MSVPPAWSTQQLAEFLAAVSTVDDHDAAGRIAVERVAEALEAEVAALVSGDQVEASVGFAAGAHPVSELIAVARGRSTTLELPGAGCCIALSAPLDEDGWLVIGRIGAEEFTREEAVLVRSMARVLVLTRRTLTVIAKERSLREQSERQAVENARLLESLTRRQMLLERLSKVQRAIVRRAGREQVLQTIVSDISELTGENIAFLRLRDHDDPSSTMLVAHEGLDADLLESIRHAPVGTGASGRCIAEGRVILMNDYGADGNRNRASASRGVRAAIAAPVRRQGDVAGALVLASYDRNRGYGSEELEMLEAFAEIASIALTDASMVDDAFRQAYEDSLTGLANRSALLERLEHALALSERGGGQVGVLFLDIDRFKTVNDSLGHSAGDELLVAVAGRLRGCIRPGDTAARLGGDEFAILLEGLTELAEAERIATRMLADLREPFPIQGRPISISASVGIATGSQIADDLLRDADLAMYRAKGDGRDRFETFEQGMHAALLARLQLEAELRRAIGQGEFVLHYQPIVDLATTRIVALEALIRWEHPQRGLIAPGEFIPLAEETRMIVSIGRYVLREACRQGAEWNRCHGEVTMTVNLSAAQLDDPDLVPEVAAALRASGLDPSLLVLEITETVLMGDSTHVRKLEELKALGIRLAVDDFGTGYSSLQYLRDLPLDVLKVAKSFVDSLSDGGQGEAFARAIVDLGESCMLEVVGEGIESQCQRERLLKLGCCLGQGFLFARPAPAGSIEALLGEARARDFDAVTLENGVFEIDGNRSLAD